MDKSNLFIQLDHSSLMWKLNQGLSHVIQCLTGGLHFFLTMIRTKVTSLKGMSARIAMITLVSFSTIRYIWTDCGIQYRVTDSKRATADNDTRQLFCRLAEIQHNPHKVWSPALVQQHLFIPARNPTRTRAPYRCLKYVLLIQRTRETESVIRQTSLILTTS